ncbi:hypothetical protein CgunFtcFv8_011040 [Champsocephalus gunnari]|uniref:Uncharacterized protein n=1 Tax=Champsocephalus gunnari TaxID=52237 RepID=A0AAN8HW04_CHAGU|nr:hypothetical protein CgunFtcFv8_011040 [Champsocephalus gunnari]
MSGLLSGGCRGVAEASELQLPSEGRQQLPASHKGSRSISSGSDASFRVPGQSALLHSVTPSLQGALLSMVSSLLLKKSHSPAPRPTKQKTV